MNRKLFSIVEVDPTWVLEQEALGSKQKFWYQNPENEQRWLFKYPRSGTGEHWAEKIAAETAQVLGMPHARVELARYQGILGSTTLSFAGRGRELIHGNQILAGKVLGYDADRKFRNSEHTFASIWRALQAAFPSYGQVRLARRSFAGYLVLDALIGNTDRHHENWGIVRRRLAGGWRDTLAPSFDHASSLGRELADSDTGGKTRRGLLEGNRLPEYVNRARGGIYWSELDRHGLCPLELVRRAATDQPHAFAPALSRIARLGPDTFNAILARVPDVWMSDEAKTFASELMHYTGGQLRALIS